AVVVALRSALLSDTQATRAAAQGAVLLLSADSMSESQGPLLPCAVLASHAVGSLLLPALLPLLDCAAVNALSAEAILGYEHPSLALRQALALEEAAAAVGEVGVTHNKKKEGPRSARRGNFGADEPLEDEDWAARVREEKNQKSALSRQLGGETYQAVALRLAAERAVTEGVVAPLLRALELWRALARAGGDAARAALLLFGSAQSLLRAPIVRTAAFDTLRVLAQNTVEGEYVHITGDLCAALRVVAMLEGGGGSGGSSGGGSEEKNIASYRALQAQSGPILGLLQSLLIALPRAAARRPTEMPLQPSSLLLVFPVLRAVLALPHTLPGTEHAFHLLDCAWPPTAAFAPLMGQGQGMGQGDAQREALRTLVGVRSVRALLPSVLDVCLRVLARVLLRAAALLGQGGGQGQGQGGQGVSEEADWAPLLGDWGLLSAETKVRVTVLEAVKQLQMMGQGGQGGQAFWDDVKVESALWVARFDENDSVRTLGQEVWGSRVHAAPSADYWALLRPLLSHPQPHVRCSAARAVAGAMAALPTTAGDCAAQLEALFVASQPAKPLRTALGDGGEGKKGSGRGEREAGVGKKGILGKVPPTTLAFSAAPVAVEDKQAPLRVALAQVLGALGEQKALSEEQTLPGAQGGQGQGLVLEGLQFLLRCGVADQSSSVRSECLLAGKQLIDAYGRATCTPLMALLQAALAQTHTGDEAAAAAFDHKHAAAVVWLGATGRHLDKADPAVLGITRDLAAALKTPSGSVQRAVADCLTPLAQALKGTDAASVLLEALLLDVLEGGTYGERKGAALGLAALVKGLGIPCLKAHDVVPRLKEACSNGSVNSRQGALLAFQSLSERLGMLFEPYIISLVEVLLRSFSHASDHVREAAEAARVIMNKLSAHGVKQVLGPILVALPGEVAWKSRQEAIRLLGMMAHCAPKQVVPALMHAGSDPHPKVKEAAKAALADISSVIRNPEVLRLSPVLLAAIADPASRTKEALEALLDCEFMHSIDAPSLALLVPILGRALRDRGADLKRKAAAITGNMVTMVSDARTLSPYLGQVLPGLRDCLLDPIPDVRTASAKAIGSLFVGMGEENEELQKLLPWLCTTLSCDASPVERSGAAQGLAEVLQSLLRLQTQDAASREGLLWFLSFLPATLNEAFASYIELTLPVVLSGLCDENEGVREVALRAGQVIVYKLGLSNTNQLIPSLAEGMFQEDWRIRQSSVQLLGELLCMVGDAKALVPGGAGAAVEGEEELDEDGVMGIGNQRVGPKIRNHIGESEYHTVLSILYVSRSDVSGTVRQAALNVWKSVVANSPRTLIEIMPVLVRLLTEKLAAPSELLRAVAGAALGDIVSKLGDKVLPAVVAPLRAGLRSDEESERQ
ncbi:armadillo-type protein, partial [Ochromonadaceae sp. CCMP2298]